MNLKEGFDKYYFENLNNSRTIPINNKNKALDGTHGVHYFDLESVFCDKQSSKCHALTPEGRKIYYDYGHRTVAGSKFFGEELAQSELLGILEGR